MTKPDSPAADTYTARLLTEGSFAFPHEGRNLDGTALRVAGLTKREYFAIHMLAGLGVWFPDLEEEYEVTTTTTGEDGKAVESTVTRTRRVEDATDPRACEARAHFAVAQADALLAALDFPKPSHPSRF